MYYSHLFIFQNIGGKKRFSLHLSWSVWWWYLNETTRTAAWKIRQAESRMSRTETPDDKAKYERRIVQAKCLLSCNPVLNNKSDSCSPSLSFRWTWGWVAFSEGRKITKRKMSRSVQHRCLIFRAFNEQPNYEFATSSDCKISQQFTTWDRRCSSLRQHTYEELVARMLRRFRLAKKQLKYEYPQRDRSVCTIWCTHKPGTIVVWDRGSWSTGPCGYTLATKCAIWIELLVLWLQYMPHGPIYTPALMCYTWGGYMLLSLSLRVIQRILFPCVWRRLGPGADHQTRAIPKSSISLPSFPTWGTVL